MKSLFASTLTLLTAMNVHAASLASLWNGEQVSLYGHMLVQGSDHPENFYILPSKYHVKSGIYYDAETGRYVQEAGVTHQVVTQGGKKYSIYNIKLELETLDKRQLIRAQSQLRSATGMDAKLKGMAPICGLSLGAELLSAGDGKPQTDPDATVITYSIRSTEADQCKSIIGTPDFTIQIRVPFEREPEMAHQIISSEGLVLPPLELIHPYKVKDKVKMTFNAKHVHEQLKKSVGLTGTWKAVTGSIDASSKKVINDLMLVGQVEVDWQGTDDSLKDQFIDRASKILSHAFLKYTALVNTKPQPEDPEKPAQGVQVVGDKDKSVSTNLFRVDLGMSEEAATEKGSFEIDFSNVSYGTVKSQTQLEVNSIPKEVLSPEVQRLME